ncbi:MAG TPA: hypothetical protein VGK23_08835 [Methanomassiliicoccales archaeon]|jgi:hypothetical protein
MEIESSFTSISDEVRSIIGPVLTTTGSNGKRMVESILKILEDNPDIYLKPTTQGFHVCMKWNGEEIKLIQIWGRLDPTKTDIMETRRQWLPESLQLGNEEYRKIAQLFLTANFTPVGGKYRNYSLHFEDARKLQFNDTVIDKVGKAIVGLKDVIKESTEQ